MDRALSGAHRRLEAARCRQIFSDFKDDAGRTLQSNLDDGGRSAHQQLDALFFYDGDPHRCEGTGVLAIASPGVRVVRICSGFARVQERQPEYAEAIILHEALHSLGLGENPPTSQQITRAVLDRCAP